jgi:hypothetical protein
VAVADGEAALRVAAVVIGVAIAVAVVAVLVFGGDDPELSPQDQATPTATATATETASSDGVVSITIGAGGLEVEPSTITRLGRTLLLAYDNTTAEDVEVILARGAPSGRAAIQKALVTGSVVQANGDQRDGVQVEPGRYTVLIRSPQEDTAPTDTVSLQVR